MTEGGQRTGASEEIRDRERTEGEKQSFKKMLRVCLGRPA